jgi:hypothetical protein
MLIKYKVSFYYNNPDNTMINDIWLDKYGYDYGYVSTKPVGVWVPPDDIVDKMVKSFEEQKTLLQEYYPANPNPKNFEGEYSYRRIKSLYLRNRLWYALDTAKDISGKDKEWGKRHTWPQEVLDLFKD